MISRKPERPIVDRRIGLAGLQHPSAAFGIALGERAGAIDEPFADMHDEIGIGGDHHEIARAHRGEDRIIILERLVVVEEAGTDDIVGAGELDQRRRQALFRPQGFEQREIALQARYGIKASPRVPR